MLKDRVRTRGYMNAIINNPQLFRGKVVLDVGCGTGILSLFCVKAGAAHVYGIECSAIADQAVRVVEDNGCADRVTIVKVSGGGDAAGGEGGRDRVRVDGLLPVLREHAGHCNLRAR